MWLISLQHDQFSNPKPGMQTHWDTYRQSSTLPPWSQEPLFDLTQTNQEQRWSGTISGQGLQAKVTARALKQKSFDLWGKKVDTLVQEMGTVTWFAEATMTTPSFLAFVLALAEHLTASEWYRLLWFSLFLHVGSCRGRWGRSPGGLAAEKQ